MISTYLFTTEGVTENVTLNNWQSLVDGKSGMLWVDIRSMKQDEIESISSLFNIHSIAIESCLDPYRRPHLWEFPDHFYLNMTTLKMTSGSAAHNPRPAELHVFVGTNFIITATQDHDCDAVDGALRQYMSSPGSCERGTLFAMYMIAEDLVATYYPLIERLDADADKLENTMLDAADKASLKRLFLLKRRAQALRKLLGPQRDIFTELSKREFKFMPAHQGIYFQDLYNRMVRLFDMLDMIREVLSGSLDIYLSTISNRLNEVMKILTIVATVMMTLAFITGFYGMNFTHLPWLGSPNAFRNIIILMFALTGGMLYLFKRKGWM